MASAEIHKYCEADVDVLRQACLKFREIFLEATDMDPFVTGVTIAGVCMAVYKRLFLKPEKITVTPFLGYNRRDMQSVLALKWLKWVSRESDIPIRMADSAEGEKVVDRYKLDGYHKDEETGVERAWEFLG